MADLPRRPNTGLLDMMECPVWALQIRTGRSQLWVTQALFFTYEEAQAVAEYESGKIGCRARYRAYGLPARGLLKRLLLQQTDSTQVTL